MVFTKREGLKKRPSISKKTGPYQKEREIRGKEGWREKKDKLREGKIKGRKGKKKRFDEDSEERRGTGETEEGWENLWGKRREKNTPEALPGGKDVGRGKKGSSTEKKKKGSSKSTEEEKISKRKKTAS